MTDDVLSSKPDPEIYISAIRKMNLLSEECLIVEDNEKGIKAATASGAHLLKVNNPSEVDYYRIKRRINEIEHG